jgi:hypothetical protein
MCVIGHFIYPNWTYHKRILAFRRVLDHKGQTIVKELEECLVERGIHRMLIISVDNASANETAIDWFKKKKKTSNKEVVCRHEFIHVRCSTHILNIIVHEDLKNVNDSIIKIQKMVKYLKSSPQRLAIFKFSAERKSVECNASLKLDVFTRWNSTYIMLEVAEKYQRTFELMLDEDGHFMNYLYDDDVQKKGLGTLTDDYWYNIRQFIKFL